MDEQMTDIGSVIRQAIAEFAKSEQVRTEPAYKTELVEERRRREQLEQRVNELVEENRRKSQQADEAERASTIRAELQRLGVQKIDLAFRAVKDEVQRSADGKLIARAEHGDVNLRDYLTHFVTENPELLPARMSGGTGMGPGQRGVASSNVDLDKLRPGMSAEELDRFRQEISRVASQTLRGM